MLKKLALVCFTLVILPCLPLMANADTSSEKNKLIEKIILDSGLQNSVMALPEQLQAQATQQKPYAKNPEVADTVMQILISSFDKQQAKQTLVNTFAQAMSQAELQQVQQWLDSDLGSRIASAERAISNPAVMHEVQMFAAGFQTNPPTQERITAVQDFLEKAKITDAAMNMVEQILRSTLTSLDQFNPQPNTAKIEKTIRTMKQTMGPMLWQQMVLMSHFTYQDFSVEEINQYTKYLASDSGHKLMQTGIDGVTNVMTQLMSRAAPQIKQAAENFKQSNQ